MSSRQTAAFMALEMGRASLEAGVQLRSAAAAYDERIGAVAMPIGELHGAQCFRTRDAVAIRFLALQAVLAEYLVECISTLFEEVLVVGLFYNRERRVASAGITSASSHPETRRLGRSRYEVRPLRAVRW